MSVWLTAVSLKMPSMGAGIQAVLNTDLLNLFTMTSSKEGKTPMFGSQKESVLKASICTIYTGLAQATLSLLAPSSAK